MPLSWNEIKSRSLAFSKQWELDYAEHAEAKSFWDGFFNVFGITRKRVASFEEPVKKLGSKQGFIDLFWKGVLLVEHKSRGKSLDKAYTQALDYFQGIPERVFKILCQQVSANALRLLATDFQSRERSIKPAA